MKQDLLHIVSTRLMSRLKPEHDFNWCEQRLSLFESITLPSLLAQTSQEFMWLLFTSAKLPTAIMQRLQDLVKPHHHIHIIPVKTKKLNSPHYAEVFEQFKQQQQLDYDFLLTSKIDDDDAWAEDYVACIQKTARRYINKEKVWKKYNGVAMTFVRGQLFYLDETKQAIALSPAFFRYFSASVDILTPHTVKQLFYSHEHSATNAIAHQENYLRHYGRIDKPMWLYTQHYNNFGKTRPWYRWLQFAEKFLPSFKVKEKQLHRYGIVKQSP